MLDLQLGFRLGLEKVERLGLALSPEFKLGIWLV